jgi:Response regulator containing a CheY-like receiver domain and an HTH DNA-binding domain
MRVLLADDHPLMLAAMRQTLTGVEGFEVVGEARSGQAVLTLVDRLAPDLVVLDLEIPGMSGLVCLDRIVAEHPQTKVVVWSERSDPERIEMVFKHGAHGYLIKSIDVADLASAIRLAVQGTAYHALGLPAMRTETAATTVGLTDRELSIVRAVARGTSNRAIGKQLFVTEQTIKFHMTNILRKLDLENRTEVARWAHGHGLFSDDET